MYNFCCFPVDPVLNSPELFWNTKYVYTQGQKVMYASS